MPVIERVGGRAPDKPNRSFKHKLFVGLGLVTLLLAGLILLLLKVTTPMVERVDTFMHAARSGRTAEAYALMSSDFRAKTTPEAFTTALIEGRLHETRKASWSSRKIKGITDGATGTLEGSLTLADGTVRPWRVELVREHGAWRIYRFEKP